MSNVLSKIFPIGRMKNLQIPRNNKSVFILGRCPTAVDNYKEGLYEVEHWIIDGNQSLSRQALQIAVDNEGSVTITLVSSNNNTRIKTNLLSPEKIDLIEGVGITLKLSQLRGLSMVIEAGEKNICLKIIEATAEKILIKRLY